MSAGLASLGLDGRRERSRAVDRLVRVARVSRRSLQIVHDALSTLAIAPGEQRSSSRRTLLASSARAAARQRCRCRCRCRCRTPRCRRCQRRGRRRAHARCRAGRRGGLRRRPWRVGSPERLCADAAPDAPSAADACLRALRRHPAVVRSPRSAAGLPSQQSPERAPRARRGDGGRHSPCRRTIR